MIAHGQGALEGSGAKFDFWGKIQKSGIRNSTTYRLPNSRKSNFATEPTDETDLACVLLASAVAPECAGDGIEDRRLGARDTAPQTEHLGESTP